MFTYFLELGTHFRISCYILTMVIFTGVVDFVCDVPSNVYRCLHKPILKYIHAYTYTDIDAYSNNNDNNR